LTAALLLFQRLIVRPMKREPVRTALTVFAVALGVAVVVAIDLAGDAATGSFRSSLETLVGDAEYEISAVGGVDEKLLGKLVSLPFPLEFSPRIEGFAVVDGTRESVALLGLDLIGDASLERDVFAGTAGVDELTTGNAVWVGPGIANEAGGTIALTINARSRDYKVAGILQSRLEDSGARDKLVVMDIAVAQEAVSKAGLVDRIQVRTPRSQSGMDWEAVLAPHLPDGISLARQGARTDENRKMLSDARGGVPGRTTPGGARGHPVRQAGWGPRPPGIGSAGGQAPPGPVSPGLSAPPVLEIGDGRLPGGNPGAHRFRRRGVHPVYPVDPPAPGGA
jgi:putative ABC transport system permease protein